MLWWDDNFSVNNKNRSTTASNGTLNEKDEELDQTVVSCYRSTGAVPIPRKLSKPPPTRGRKLSAPSLDPTPGRPKLTRKISCPAAPLTATMKATQQMIEELKTETEEEFTKPPLPASFKARLVSEPSRPALYPKINKVRIQTGKVETQEPDMKKELKRGSMREKWGLSLVYQLMDSRLQIAVNKVHMFSPAAKAGILPGNTILIINDWRIEAMDQPQVAINLLLAAGFSVNLALSNTQLELSNWTGIDVL